MGAIEPPKIRGHITYSWSPMAQKAMTGSFTKFLPAVISKLRGNVAWIPGISFGIFMYVFGKARYEQLQHDAHAH